MARKSISGLAMLLGPVSKKNPGEPDKEKSAGRSESRPLEDAMADFLGAVRDDDPSAMADIFRAAVTLAEDEGRDEPAEDDDMV